MAWLHFDTEAGAKLTDDDGNEIAQLARWETEQRANPVTYYDGPGAVKTVAGRLEATVTMEFWVSDMDAFNDFMRQWLASRRDG